jgi:AhpD family alkylhydroperoxidase
MKNIFDEKTVELIAVGCSVAAHCQPCLTYHVGKAREMGIAEEEIVEAINVGKMVEKGSSMAMNKFANEVTGSTAKSGPCCSDQKGNCCG